MIVTYLRSSSYNTYDFCQRKYFLDYVLGWGSPSNSKAEMGNFVHKMLELTARIKLAQQNKEDEITDKELGTFAVADLDYDLISQIVFENLSKNTQDLYNWQHKDFKLAKKWYYSALNYNNGMFNPMNQNIVQPEQYFDFKIEKPWAWYDYKLPSGEIISGYLSIKGTVDLVVKLDKNTYELIDYKTGKRMDWNTGEEKTLQKLYKDPQLILYYYALTLLYPKIEHFIITIFFINDGGAFSMSFDRKYIIKAEKMLKARFDHIRNNFKPKIIYPDWKCTKLCHFGKNDMQDRPVSSYKDSICANVGKELLQLGMDKVMINHSKRDIRDYGSGGGVTRK